MNSSLSSTVMIKIEDSEEFSQNDNVEVSDYEMNTQIKIDSRDEYKGSL